jgi:hypothetical protein
MRTSSAVLSLAILLVLASLPSGVQAQADQQALARQILEGDDRAASDAVGHAERMTREGEEVGPELRAALITALERQNRAYRKHSEMQHARRRDPEIERAFWGEGYIILTRAVVRLRHPETIEALAGALTIGGPPARVLAEFGEEAAPVLLDIAEGEAWEQAQAMAAMISLRLMIEEPKGAPLSASTLERIRRLARAQLSGNVEYPEAFDMARNHVRIPAAISLALALDDPSLGELVRALAREPEAIRRLGIEDPAAIENVQRHAAQELARRPMGLDR